MKTIWYAIVNSIEVQDDMSDDEINDKMLLLSGGKYYDCERI